MIFILYVCATEVRLLLVELLNGTQTMEHRAAINWTSAPMNSSLILLHPWYNSASPASDIDHARHYFLKHSQCYGISIYFYNGAYVLLWRYSTWHSCSLSIIVDYLVTLFSIPIMLSSFSFFSVFFSAAGASSFFSTGFFSSLGIRPISRFI